MLIGQTYIFLFSLTFRFLVAADVEGGALLVLLLAAIQHARLDFVAAVLEAGGWQSDPEDCGGDRLLHRASSQRPGPACRRFRLRHGRKECGTLSAPCR